MTVAELDAVYEQRNAMRRNGLLSFRCWVREHARCSQRPGPTTHPNYTVCMCECHGSPPIAITDWEQRAEERARELMEEVA